MVRKKVLVQWIGHSDLRAMAASLPKAKQDAIYKKIKKQPATAGDLGPTKTLVSSIPFDDIRLLSTYGKTWNDWYKKWLAVPAEIEEVELEKPTDYASIFSIAEQQLSDVKKASRRGDVELCLHLSPGTPAMAAVWLLLGKTRFPATFYETWAGSWWVTDVPFDLIDVMPDVLKKPDAFLQHLASKSPSQVEGFQSIAGNSPAIREAVGRSKRAAIRSVSVLLLGESGTGKEMFAKAIHRSGPRSSRPFKAINCAAISKTLLESELFGHGKGAFTGADKERKGAFESANGGTVFLDEVGECALETQAKLLRVLQPITGEGASIRRVCRLGEEKDRKVDVRIIAATNRDLHHAIAEGQFREDLYYRLAAVTIRLPPLRDRKGDIPVIAAHLLGLINQQFAADEPGYKHKTISASANKFVKEQYWPGNVRQLYNALVQAAVFTDGQKIDRQELQAAVGETPPTDAGADGALNVELGNGFSLETHISSIKRAYLERAMKESSGVKAKAARLLGMKNYQTLDAQLKRLKVTSDLDN